MRGAVRLPDLDNNERIINYLKDFILFMTLAAITLKRPHLGANERQDILDCWDDYVKCNLYILGHILGKPEASSQEVVLSALIKTSWAMLHIGQFMPSASTTKLFRRISADHARSSKKPADRRARAKEELRAMGAASFPKSIAKAEEIAPELRRRLGFGSYPGDETVKNMICEIVDEAKG